MEAGAQLLQSPGQGGQDNAADLSKTWSVKEVLDIMKGFNRDDLQQLKNGLENLLKACLRDAPPKKLADWDIKLVPKEPEYPFVCYLLTVKGKEYAVKASESSWLVAAGTMENRCGKFKIGEELSIEHHTCMYMSEQYNHCGDFEELQDELEMDADQLAVLLYWLFEVISCDVSVELVKLATWYEFPAYQFLAMDT